MTSSPSAQIYHRLGDSAEAIGEIKRSQKLKGRAPRNIFESPFPTVQAYVGPLNKNDRGFEFATEVPPDSGCPPLKANWRACTEKNGTCRKGIEVETINGEEWAVIVVTVGKVQ
jgi:hypothetical protein